MPLFPFKVIQNLNFQMKLPSKRVIGQMRCTEDDQLTTLQRRKLIKSTVVLQMQKKWIWSEFIEKFKALVPLRYNKRNKYKQQWQKHEDVGTEEVTKDRWLLQNTDGVYMLIVCITLIVYSLFLWLQSLKEIFLVIQIPLWIKIVWLIVVLGDVFVELHTSKIVNENEITCKRKIREVYLSTSARYDVINLIVVIVMMFFQTGELMSVICSAISVYTLYHKVTEKYRIFKMYSLDVEMLHQFKILQLFLVLLLMGHIFSILMYGAALIAYNSGEQQNWVIAAKIQAAPWFTRYIYALYWAVTTMTTVGYGDIHGTNQIEFIVCIIAQILGSALFGYTINVIGMTLTDMKKSRQQLEDELFIWKKVAKCFSVSKTLAYRIRNYIQNNHIAKSSVKIDQEKRLFDKMEPRLKNEILHDTNMKIVQKNTLLLTKFTSNFRNQIAVKLIKKIFQPNQFLQNTENDFSMFLIDKGTVEIMYNKRHHNQTKHKVIRTIKQTGQRVSPNTYGLAELILQKKLNLSAKSKNFTVAYQLKKQDFFQIMEINPLDFERYCQLKQQIMSSSCPQSFEGELLLSPKHHYCPNRLIIIRKHSYSPLQSRTKVDRLKQRLKNQLSFVSTSLVNISIEEEIDPPSSQNVVKSRNIIMPMSTKRDLGMLESQKIINKKDKGESCQVNFDSIRSFDNYFPRCNFNWVIHKYYCWLLDKQANPTK